MVYFTGKTNQSFFNEEINKACYKIQSAWQTNLSLQSTDCSYQVQKFTDENCDDDSDDGESHLWNSRERAIILNDLKDRSPVCSFFIPYSTLNGQSILVTFKQVGGEKRHRVNQANCYNLCDGKTGLYYPYTLEFHQSNGRIAGEYYAKLYSNSACDEENAITYNDGEIVQVRHGANLVALTQKQAETLSYMILPE